MSKDDLAICSFAAVTTARKVRENPKFSSRATLDLPWTTSPAEGQINRLKMLKRTMYGRAGFPLLRARVLNAA